MMKHMIQEQIDVEDAEATKSFGKGDRREDYADMWRNTGNVILVGLPGSGKETLATLLADTIGQIPYIPLSADAAVTLLKGERSIIVLSDVLVEDPAVQPLIHGAGKVFYLMADSKTLASRLAIRDGAEDEEQLWRDMSARLAVMEPVFYSILHFILPGMRLPEELLADALEKIAF